MLVVMIIGLSLALPSNGCNNRQETATQFYSALNVELMAALYLNQVPVHTQYMDTLTHEPRERGNVYLYYCCRVGCQNLLLRDPIGVPMQLKYALLSHLHPCSVSHKVSKCDIIV